MKTHQLKKRLTEILAAALPALLAAVLTPVPARAGAKMEVTPSSTACQFPCRVATISGGEGASVWKIEYRSGSANPVEANFVEAGPDRAWFSHGMWLRLIDTKQGVVIGRWRFPSQIVSLALHGNGVRLGLLTVEARGHHVVPEESAFVDFDPAAPRIAEWSADRLFLYLSSVQEAVLPRLHVSGSRPISPEDARPLIPYARERVRRDPLSPWFRVVLARLLEATADPQRQAEWDQAVRTPGADFTELLPISADLDIWGHPELAKEAFERGYRDFLDRGYDPRMNFGIIGRLMIYRLGFGSYWRGLNYPDLEEHLERVYRLSPSGESAGSAWELHAAMLEHQGHAQAAAEWRQRELEAETYASPLFDQSNLKAAAWWLLVAVAGFLALVIFVSSRVFHYRPQRRLDRAQGMARSPWGAYWSRGERRTFLAIALLSLAAALGSLGSFAAGLNAWSLPSSATMGRFASPQTLVDLQAIPATPERDLLIAVGRQQRGETAEAAEIYRRLPDFAESWNNLGVMQQNDGRATEAKQSFEKALALDPQLSEAKLNLGMPPADLWTTQYHDAFPGRPMPAVPRARRLCRALNGGSLAANTMRAVQHPLETLRQDPWEDGARFLAFGLLLLLAAVFGFLLVFATPYRDVTTAPPENDWAWALLFPGLAPAWRYLTWCVLPGAVTLLLLMTLFWHFRQPFWSADFLGSNLSGSYGVPADISPVLTAGDWLAILGLPVLLYAANVAVVLRGRSSSTRGT